MKTRIAVIAAFVALAISTVRINAGGIVTTGMSVTYTNGSDAFQQTFANYNVSVGGSNRVQNSIAITNGGWTQITFPNVPQAGICFGRNITSASVTGMVVFSYDATNAAWATRPNRIWYVDMATNQLYATVIDGTATQYIVPNILPK